MASAAARFITSICLLVASLAWAGWIYLHTVGDPSRDQRIAHAVLDNPDARNELAADIATSIANAAKSSKNPTAAAVAASGDDPDLRAAVSAALADPAIASNVVDAIAAEHEIALGVAPSHPAVINSTALIAAVKAHLAPVDPALAKAIPSVGPKQIKLPAAKVPLARQLRDLARHWVLLLTLAAAGGVVVSFVIAGTARGRVLRRAGGWGIGAGLTWAILPPVIEWASKKWWKSQAAIVRAVVHGATAEVSAVAVVFVLAGGGAIALSYVLPRLPRPSAWGSPPGGRAVPQAPAGTPPVTGWQSIGRTRDTWERRPPVSPVGYDEHGDPV